MKGHNSADYFNNGVGFAGAGNSYCINTVIYNFNAASTNSTPASGNNPSGTFYFYNCTFIGGYSGFRLSDGTANLKNCYSKENGAYSYYATGGTMNLTTCASSDTTGSSGLQSIAVNTTNFTNVTAGSEDFHLPSGSALIGVGTNLYNDANYPFQTDIDNQDRGGLGATWDIGADQFIITGASAWGHDTGVTQTNVRNFSGKWYGTGEVVSTGDGERIELADDEYLISEIIAVPADSTVTLRKNSYFMRA